MDVQEVLYKGRAFDVVKDPATGYDIVQHAPVVVLVVCPKPGHFYMVNQRRPAVNQYLWELPAGGVDPGETLYDAAVRECREETGFRPYHIKKLAQFYPSPGYCSEVMEFFLLTDLVEDKLEGDEPNITVALWDITWAIKAIREGQIQDLKTVAGISMLI